MCGINGFYNFAKVMIPNGEELIKSMNKILEHRGPDDTGVWIDYNHRIYFGHQRLSILDLSCSGHQPMISTKGTTIIYNGEIYNFKSIKEELKEYSFVSETDTEVILYLYDQQKVQCLEKLNGMFAFAIWDAEREELFLARDRIGIKPLYYTMINGVFAFSSEIKSLLALPWIKAELDEESLYHFLTYDYVFPPQTMFKKINKFHPGYRMIVGKNGIRVYEPYWEIAYSDYNSLSDEELQELVFSELERSVKSQMVSDVPVGSFLSGGVDSSSITAIMSKQSSYPVKTFSIGFKNAPTYDELDYARKISKQFGTIHFEKIVTPQEIKDFLPKIVDIFDEPLADATTIPIYFLSKLARENGTHVILTGDGADEIFCGYRRFMRYAQLYPLYRLLYKLPTIIKFAIADIYRRIDHSSPIYDILNKGAKGQFFLGGSPGFKESTKHRFLTPGFLRRIGNVDSYDQILFYRQLYESLLENGRENKYIDWLCFMGLKSAIPNRYLYRADHLSMAHSVELRVPFLDHTFVNLALSIPGKWKIRNGEPKYILKKSLEQILPNEILYRKKQGFCVPLREWIEGYLLDYINENLQSFCKEIDIFNENGLRYQIEQVKAGNKNYTFSLWNIYFLMSWFKRWIL